MECKAAKRSISGWVDGEVNSTKKLELESHLRSCLSCQKEVQACQTLNSLLWQAVSSIEPSNQFDTTFWNKVADRQRAPWFVQILNDLESLIPTPNLKQAVAFATLAFFIGNLGGAVSAMNAEVPGVDPATSIKQYSALQGYKGIPSYSLAATYLRGTELEVSK